MDLRIKLKRNKSSLSLQEQRLFLNRLNVLFKQHYPLLEALSALKWNSKWKLLIDQMITQLKEGQRFDEVLANLNFDKKIVSFLFFSMVNGNMTEAIQISIHLIDQQLLLFKKFQKVIRYPLLLFLSLGCLLYFIYTQVYPAFLQLFLSTSYHSSITLIAMYSIEKIFIIFFILFLVMFFLLLIWTLTKHKYSITKKIYIYQKLPIARYYIRSYFTFLFAIHLSALLKSGLSLKDSIKIIQNQKQQPILSYYSGFLLRELTAGRSIADAIPFCRLFKTDLATLFQKHSNTTLLKKDLTMYGHYLLDDIQTRLVKSITLVQPILFIFIAFSIIFIYLSILIPMFQLIQHI